MADIKIGTSAINKFYMGSTAVDKLYLGTTEIWKRVLTYTNINYANWYTAQMSSSNLTYGDHEFIFNKPISFTSFRMSSSGQYAGDTYINILVKTDSYSNIVINTTGEINVNGTNYTISSIGTLKDGYYYVDFTRWGNNPRFISYQARSDDSENYRKRYALANAEGLGMGYA